MEDKNSKRKAQMVNCRACDKKQHYRYTREELQKLYVPGSPITKICFSDHGMENMWLNYIIEDD